MAQDIHGFVEDNSSLLLKLSCSHVFILDKSHTLNLE